METQQKMSNGVNKKINLGFITVTVIVFVLAITALGLSGYASENEISQLAVRTVSLNPHPLQTGGRVAGVEVEAANIGIDRGNGTTISLDFEVQQGMTVLDALKKAAKAFGLDLQVKGYGDQGSLVEGIGNLIGGQDSKYWISYLNGQMLNVAVDKQTIAPGDKIEFLFQKSPY